MKSRYRLDFELGKGAMGTVWAARDERIRRPVAVKLIWAGPHLSAAHLQDTGWRFEHEVKALGGLCHRNIAGLHDCGETELKGARYHFLVMERVSGTDLARVFASGQPVPWYDVLHWGQQIGEALAAAQEQRVVHRDIKPANVILNDIGEVKVLDFGIARILDPSRRVGWTDPGRAIGTPAYMSPEQIRADEDTDHRSDLYSLGCLLYEGLSGRLPFNADTRSDLFRQHADTPPPPLDVPGLPPAAARVVLRLLEKRPADRPQSAAEVVHLIARVLEAHRRALRPGAPADLAAANALREQARREAEELLTRAETEARVLREEAERYADAVRAGADPRARETREEAERYAAHLLAGARRERDRILRESRRRRGHRRGPVRIVAAATAVGKPPPRDPGGAERFVRTAAPVPPTVAAGDVGADAAADAAGAAPAVVVAALRMPLMLTAAPARRALEPGPRRAALAAGFAWSLPVGEDMTDLIKRLLK
ncbi:protein kinase [Streptomyces sp. NPDC056491]|uniref:serine/threonine-protein kinase n=1 Tax=Streptomyces sp. NPDC056491 TaxID=3345837 RepID=UPI003677B478